MDPSYAWRFLPMGYTLTVLLEMPVLLIGLSAPHSWRRRIAAGLWLNACSYPVVILALPALIDPFQQRTLYTAIAEVFAPVAECVVFALAFHTAALTTPERRRDFAAIVVANLTSFLVGDWFLHTPIGERLLASLVR